MRVGSVAVVVGFLMVITSIMSITRRRIVLGRHGRMIEYTGPQAVYHGIVWALLGIAVLVGACNWFWQTH